MNTNRKYINNTERFTSYENGELSEDERKDLEADLIKNSDLKIEFRVYQEVNEFLKRNHKELKKKFYLT